MPEVFTTKQTNLPQWDGGTDFIRADTYEHHEIHAGSHYRVQANNAALGSGGTLVIAWKTPDTGKQMHLIFEWVGGTKGDIMLYRGATWTGGTGTQRTAKNSNDNFPDASNVRGDGGGAFVTGEVVVDPTGLVTGTDVRSVKAWYGTKTSADSTGSRRSEIVLQDDTPYALVLTNNDTSANGFQVRLGWYEHTPKR
jgi:hypothetical protein